MVHLTLDGILDLMKYSIWGWSLTRPQWTPFPSYSPALTMAFTSALYTLKMLVPRSGPTDEPLLEWGSPNLELSPHCSGALTSAPHNLRHLPASTCFNLYIRGRLCFPSIPHLITPACTWETFATNNRNFESPPRGSKGEQGQGWPSSSHCSSHLAREASRVFFKSHQYDLPCHKLWKTLLLQFRERKWYRGGGKP